MTRRVLVASAGLFAAAGFAGCARPGFPPGGPLDTTAPRVVAVAPGDSMVNIPAESPIEILFSESMDRTSVRDGVRIYPPPAGRPQFDWSGRSVRIEWDRPLAARTTYIVLVSGTARDARGVAMGMPVSVRFSTGPSIDRGRITGVLRARTLRRHGVPILAFPDTLGLRPDTTGLLPSYATETDTAGVYAFSGLPVGRGFTIHAFFDLNTNGAIDPETDLIASYPEVVRLTPEREEADSINIVAVDPRAPAVLTGSIATRDSTARFRVDAQEISDSSLVRRVERIGPGAFTLRVPAGTFRLRATRVPPAESLEEPIVVTRAEPVVAKPEEEYGPFEFVFGAVGERPPPPPEDEEED